MAFQVAIGLCCCVGCRSAAYSDCSDLIVLTFYKSAWSSSKSKMLIWMCSCYEATVSNYGYASCDVACFQSVAWSVIFEDSVNDCCFGAFDKILADLSNSKNKVYSLQFVRIAPLRVSRFSGVMCRFPLLISQFWIRDAVSIHGDAIATDGEVLFKVFALCMRMTSFLAVLSL